MGCVVRGLRRGRLENLSVHSTLAPEVNRNSLMQIVVFNWFFLLVLIPVAFFWLRRAYRILIKRDFSEVALKKGVPPANAEKYAPYEMAINLVAGLVMVVVLVAVLGFQALKSEDWIAIAGVTLWIKLLLSFALGRQAHGLGPAKRAGKEKTANADKGA